jgi:hypothetical protein
MRAELTGFPARLACLSIAFLIGAGAGAGAGAQAQWAPLRGHVKAQQQYLTAPTDSLAASLGHRDAEAASIDFRLIGELSAGRFAFEADYFLLGVDGSAEDLQSRIEAEQPDLFIDREATQWLDLSRVVSDTSERRAVQSLDRFSMSYTTDRWVIKLGRQAYSWANGIVFRPLDLFDPFAPDAVDQSYKPGIDAVYAQRLLASGSDVVALIVPRRDPATGRVTNAQSSAAVKWHVFGSKLQMDLLAARDYRDAVLGLGLTGPWGQAVWRLSVVPVWLDTGGARISLVANVEHAWQWKARNVSGFLEYFRNGLGRADRGYALDELAPELVARLARGQLFDTGRDYVAAGLRMQLTPLLEVDPALIVNLGDHSTLSLVQGSYSIAQNLALDFGVRLAFGAKGTEFGGLPQTAAGSVLVAPPARLYARLAFYF